MNRHAWILLLSLAAPCLAQSHCDPAALPHSAARVLALQKEMKQIKLPEMDTGIPPAVSAKMTLLKDALSSVSDTTLACAVPSLDPSALQNQLAQALHANAPEPPENTAISADDHRYEEITGSFGHNLRVKVSRPPGVSNLLQLQYSINIECGDDNMLLLYELHNGVWAQKLRWQSPPLKEVSDAFGDFFLATVLRAPATSPGSDEAWQVAVAHGRPWCTSRFSGFQIELLSPTDHPAFPQVLWHTKRGYSRGDFEPSIKSSGNTFELRLNDDCMSFDNANCFERRVIYHYRVDSDNQVRRVGPLAINARGFVSEWLTAPWTEARDFSSTESLPELQRVHDHFDPPSKPNDNQYRGHSYGPVRACPTPRTFQVQINSTQEKIVPGKPGGESTPLPSLYFQVREVADGYEMLSAPTTPDPKCTGPNLMPNPN
jgi:hypothetical protein